MRVRLLPLLAVVVIATTACSLFSSNDDTKLKWSPSALPAATIGQPYSVTITVSDNKTPVYSLEVSSGTLPAGLTFAHPENESTATITGTPTEAGTFSFELSAACFGTNSAGQTGSHRFELVVG